MGMLAEVGPFSSSSDDATPGEPTYGVGFVAGHQSFIRQISAFTRCFERWEVVGFSPEELDDHLAVALLDNKIIQDGDRYCTDQVAYEMKDATKGYNYPSRR